MFEDSFNLALLVIFELALLCSDPRKLPSGQRIEEGIRVSSGL